LRLRAPNAGCGQVACPIVSTGASAEPAPELVELLMLEDDEGIVLVDELDDPVVVGEQTGVVVEEEVVLVEGLVFDELLEELLAKLALEERLDAEPAGQGDIDFPPIPCM
jgi:hypothetical protein